LEAWNGIWQWLTKIYKRKPIKGKGIRKKEEKEKEMSQYPRAKYFYWHFFFSSFTWFIIFLLWSIFFCHFLKDEQGIQRKSREAPLKVKDRKGKTARPTLRFKYYPLPGCYLPFPTLLMKDFLRFLGRLTVFPYRGWEEGRRGTRSRNYLPVLTRGRSKKTVSNDLIRFGADDRPLMAGWPWRPGMVVVSRRHAGVTWQETVPGRDGAPWDLTFLLHPPFLGQILLFVGDARIKTIQRKCTWA
jgi:hypothetical protein